ncbi:MAG: hypothetical protein Q9169_005185 [Polycauliona sp. 2 TL-2023]
MDPASIFSVIAGATGLAVQCGKLIVGLHNVTDMYKNANLTLVSLSTGLETIQWAWRRIQAILEMWNQDEGYTDQLLDTDTIHQLDRSLKGGRLVIEALEKDLIPLMAEAPQEQGTAIGPGILNKVQVIWNATALREHQERLRDQMNSMNLMISVLKLPNAIIRQQSLNANVDILRKSDESAYSIVPSRLSVHAPSIRSHMDHSLISSIGEDSLIYRELAFDDDLFSARVYKRNYLSRAIRDVRREANTEDFTSKTKKDMAKAVAPTNAAGTEGSNDRSTIAIHEPRIPSFPHHPLLHHPGLTSGHLIITGWMCRTGRYNSHSGRLQGPYLSFRGPVVDRALSKENGLSDWEKIDTDYLELDCENVLQKFDWGKLFEMSINRPTMQNLFKTTSTSKTTTRREYTDALTTIPPPSFAKAAWTSLFTVLRDSTNALANHSAMTPNINYPYGKPANRKTKIYPMWDFVSRTLSMTLALDMTLPRREKGLWNEVEGRSRHAKRLMLDMTGRLDSICPDDYGTGVEFGENVMEITRRSLKMVGAKSADISTSTIIPMSSIPPK